MPEKILENKVAIITGGGRGIGKAIARSFAREGASVLLMSRTQSELEEAAQDIRKQFPVRVEIFSGDVAREEDVRRMAEYAASRLGNIDILVHAAGIIQPIALVEAGDSQAWEHAVRVNLFGTRYAIKAVMPYMKKARQGAIVVFSGGGETPMPGFSAYASSKAAVVKFAETVAEEVGSFGITVNSIAPGPINTRMFDDILRADRDAMTPGQWDGFRERKEQGGASVEKVCELALFLSSDAGRTITGKLLSAQWDSVEALLSHAKELSGSDIYTMRRIKPEDRGKHWQ